MFKAICKLIRFYSRKKNKNKKINKWGVVAKKRKGRCCLSFKASGFDELNRQVEINSLWGCFIVIYVLHMLVLSSCRQKFLVYMKGILNQNINENEIQVNFTCGTFTDVGRVWFHTMSARKFILQESIGCRGSSLLLT